MTRRTLGWLTVVLVFTVLGAAAMYRPVQAQRRAAVAPVSTAKYSIIETDGTNLLVVDNSVNTLYFYTVEPGKEVGSDLHLRGSLDLNEVGKATIKPKKMADK